MSGPRLVRVAELDRPSVSFVLDGQTVTALAGDTVLTAVLTTGNVLRQSEFDDGMRAGFCLMGACQDCWMWLENGDRLRACSTEIQPGMRLLTHPPEESRWPNLAS